MDQERADAKRSLRRELRLRRDDLSAAERSWANAQIEHLVKDLPQFTQAGTLFTYLSVGSEADTRALIQRAWSLGKEVAIPRCTGPCHMEWFRIEDFQGLEQCSLGILEPPFDPERKLRIPDANALAIVPGLAFDAQGFRLGYGGGFYDAFLESFPGTSIGLCYDCQRVQSLEALGARDPHDLPVDQVICAVKDAQSATHPASC